MAATPVTARAAGSSQRLVCWRAATPSALSWHLRIRHRVFVEEQRIIPFTDVDEWDSDPDTVHVLAGRGSDAIGTVRLYRTDTSGRWKGDRLAVLPGCRAGIVGMRLVRFAVSEAAAAGGTVMDAIVQLQNVTFFERLGWQHNGPSLLYYGLAHQPMTFTLSRARHLAHSDIPDDACLRLPAAAEEPSALLGTM